MKRLSFTILFTLTLIAQAFAGCNGYGMFGMGGQATDPGEINFTQRVKAEIPDMDIHGSPYTDQQAGEIAAAIEELPPEACVIVWGTSLGSNNVPVVGNYTRHTIDGAFGFQASIYGAKGYTLKNNIKFAHLISSNSPIPFAGLGAYVWPLGTMNPASYHHEWHNIPHPGDYDQHDQTMFINEMKRIIASHP